MKADRTFITEMDRLAEKWDICAAIQIEDGYGASVRKAYGFADRKTERKMTLDDRFCLSAHNLFFLSLCMLHLVQRGRIKLSDKINRFIPEYKEGHRITVAQLLRMESGLPDELYQVRLPLLQKDGAHVSLSDEEKFRKEYEIKVSDVPFSQVLERIGEMELTHIPGKEDDGSFTAIPFLAEIILRLEKKTALEYLFEQMFRPLGMDDTYPGNDGTVGNFGCFKDVQQVALPSLSPSHAFTTTLADMNKLARGVVEKRVLSERALQLALHLKGETQGIGLYKLGDIFCADNYPRMMGNDFRIYFDFKEKMTRLILNSEDFISRRENGEWLSFPGELRRYFQYAQAYPDKPEFKKITGKNVWDALDIQLTPAQLSFVPDAKSCIAGSLARRHPVYLLKDHGLPVGIAALTVDDRKKEYHVDFLQVDHRLQGRGYGRILLTRALDVLKKAGAKKLEIGVNRFNIPAQKLYLSVGFELERVYEEFMELKMEL